MKKLISVSIALATLMFSCTMLAVNAESALDANPAVMVEASEKTQLKVVGTDAEPGSDIDLTLEMDNNPGVIAVTVDLSYDTDVLELVSVDDKTLFEGASFTPGGDLSAVPFKLMWVNELSKDNYTDNGVLAILHFHVKDTAAGGSSDIKLTVDENNTFDVNMDNVALTVQSGVVSISSDNAAENPSDEKPAAEDPSDEKPAAEDPSDEKPAAEDPSDEKPAAENPSEEKPAAEDPSDEKPAAEDPSEEKPAAENPSEEKPAAENPSDEEPEVDPTPEEPQESSVEYFATINELCDMAKKDYKTKNGIYPSNAVATELENGSLSIQLFGENEEILDTYTIDPTTGIGISATGDSVSLPQTGNNSMTTAAAAVVAGVLTAIGAYATWKSGVFRRRKEDE